MQNYSFLQKKLHHLCLGNQIIKKSLFEIEKILFAKKMPVIQHNQHIFITGLPRSGTTILLEFLYETKEFASLTYSDMPFILSSNLFSKFIKKQNFDLKERMHNDGIQFNLQSPEAFDEVFFKTFNVNELKDNLTTFIALVLKKYDKKLYLSKNNNNYKRIELIHSMLSNAKFIIPFRNPLQHANSLLSQHIHFSSLQRKNKFILDYMNYLGHFEFGLNHQYWNKSKEYNDISKINYWLEQWLFFYENLLNKFNLSTFVIFISYEQMCNNINFKSTLLEKLNLKRDLKFNFKLSRKKIVEDYNKELLNKCNDIYDQLTIIQLRHLNHT